MTTNYTVEIDRELRWSDAFEAQCDLTNVREPVILDIGAHTGQVTQRYRELFPSGTIHAFEPFPEAFIRLRDRFLGDSLVYPHELAMAQFVGERTLHSNMFAPTNSLLASDDRADQAWGPNLLSTTEMIRVGVTTVDSFLATEAIEYVDILKLDVQGGEYEVLEGAMLALRNVAIGLIYLEIILAPTYVDQRSLWEYLHLLDGTGYTLIDFYHPIRKSGVLVQLDAVFCAPHLLNGHQ